MEFRIRLLESHEDYLQAEAFQRTVWGFPDREVNSLNELTVVQRIGGFVFGAYDAEGEMAGFCFGVPALKKGRVYHYSRMLGVLPKYQDRGLGFKMKLHQRDLVLKQKLDLIRWTFDPLQSRNAFFNLEKLGVVIREYIENIYGRSASTFNAGLETDRFVPEWHLRSPAVRAALRGRRVPVSLQEVIEGRPWEHALDAQPTESGICVPETARLNVKSPQVCVEIPPDIDRLKNLDMETAQAWRFETRKVFQRLFQRGYVVTGCSTGIGDRRRRCFYLLERSRRGS